MNHTHTHIYKHPRTHPHLHTHTQTPHEPYTFTGTARLSLSRRTRPTRRRSATSIRTTSLYIATPTSLFRTRPLYYLDHTHYENYLHIINNNIHFRNHIFIIDLLTVEYISLTLLFCPHSCLSLYLSLSLSLSL